MNTIAKISALLSLAALPAFYGCGTAGNENCRRVTLTLGEEHVVVRGIRPEEHFWGPYQFPRPYNLDRKSVV